MIIDTARRRKLRTEESLEDLREERGFDPPAEEDTSAQTRIDAVPVMSVLQALEEPLRTAVVMRYIDGFSPHEIAEFLGVSANVVSVRIHRGVAALRSRLHYGS